MLRNVYLDAQSYITYHLLILSKTPNFLLFYKKNQDSNLSKLTIGVKNMLSSLFFYGRSILVIISMEKRERIFYTELYVKQPIPSLRKVAPICFLRFVVVDGKNGIAIQKKLQKWFFKCAQCRKITSKLNSFHESFLQGDNDHLTVLLGDPLFSWNHSFHKSFVFSKISTEIH